jgi:DNA-binding CsgD family transcriptional regulator
MNDRGLLERTVELAAITAAAHRACSGSGSLVVVQGAAGLGKSRLLELGAELGAGVDLTVLRARGEEMERSRPWALASMLFAEPVAGPLASALSPLARQAAELLVPGPAAPPDSFEDPLPLIHALFWLTTELAAETPLMLVVDDAHWGDDQSLRFVRYLLPRLTDLPVLVLIAMRPGEPGVERAELDALAGDERVELLRPAALSSDAVEELLRKQLHTTPDNDLVQACAEVTGGNPFYLHELLLELRTEADRGEPLSADIVRQLNPESVARTVFLRLSRLGADTAALARAVSILGDRAAFPHAAELAQLDHRATSAGLDLLAAADILDTHEPLGFVHPLVAQAIYGDIAPGERGDLHKRAARLLDRDGAAPEVVASQLLLAGRRADPWTVAALCTAATRALTQGAPSAGALYLRRALEEPPGEDHRPTVLELLGRAEALTGQRAASSRFSAAIELAADPGDRARLQLALGRALAVAGEHEAASAAFAAGRGELDDPKSELARELDAAWWASARVSRSHRPDSDGPDHTAVLDVHDPTLAQRQLLAQLALQRGFEGAGSAELLTLADRAWGDGALLQSETSDGLSWTLVTGALLYADELERELEVCDAVLADARRRGSPMAFATVSYCRGLPLLHQGRVDEAIADLEAAVAARGDGWSAFLGSAASCLALAQIESGSLTDARAALALAENDPATQGSLQYLMLLAARGSLRLAEGDPAAALEDLLAFGRLSAEAGVDFSGAFAWQATAAIAACAGGDLDQGRELGRLALTSASSAGSARNVAHAHRALGHAERGDRALEHFNAAIKALENRPPRLQYAHALVDLGAALRRAHRRGDAREHRRPGVAIAVAGGSHALAGRARTELAAAGARSVAHTRSGLESLTPSERRIVELAAAGHTNKNIAQTLFVTVKAVEYHLANSYRKLGVSRRGDLAELLGEP